jgi:hypothetical protein
MLKLIRNIVVVVLFVVSSKGLFAQTETNARKFKQSFGTQYNYAAPSLYDYIWRGHTKRNVFAFRCGYIIYPNIIIGPEISGFVYRNEYARLTTLNYGGFARYSLQKVPIIRPFAEISIYYSHYFGWYIENSINEVKNKISESVGVAGYIAPGISICMLKNRISYDVMYKFSNKELVFLKNNMISFRLNYNFNFKK